MHIRNVSAKIKRLFLFKKNKFKECVAVFILLFSVFIFFNEIFLQRGLLLSEDLLEVNYHFYKFIFDFLRKGVFVTWVPYVFCGMPLVANIELSLFYPLNLIFYLILPLPEAFSAIVPMHFFLAGLFMYLYVRILRLSKFSSLISAFIFMFNGFLLDRHQGLHELGTYIWLPLILFFVEKGLRKNSYFYIVLAGIAMGIQFLGGQFQLSYYIALILLSYLIWKCFILFRQKKSFKMVLNLCIMWMVIFAIGIGIFAIQLFPGYELTKVAARNNMTYDYATAEEIENGGNEVSLIEFILPNIFGGIYTNPFLGAHIGIIPLLLAIIAILFRKRRIINFFLIVGLISFALAMGKLTPLFHLFYSLNLPGYFMLKSPDRFEYLLIFSIAVLSGLGFDILIKTKERKERYRQLLILVVFAVAFIVIVSGTFFWNKYINIPRFGKLLPTRNLAIPIDSILGIVKKDLLIFISLSISFTMIIILHIKNKIPLKFLKSIILISVYLNLFLFAKNLIFITNKKQADILLNESETARFLKKDKTLFRVSTYNYERDAGIYANLFLNDNTSISYGIFSVSGDLTFPLRRYLELTKGDFEINPLRRRAYEDFHKNFNLLSLLNCKYIIDDKNSNIFDIDGFKEVYRNDICKIYLYENYLPRAFFVRKAMIIKDKQSILDTLKSESFNPKEYVILEEVVDQKIEEPIISEWNSKTEIVEYLPNEITIYNKSQTCGFLVLLDTNYPGWKVYIDNKLDKIYQANYLFRAVYLAKGYHTVRFIYDPTSFKLGALVTFFTLCISIISLYIIRHREKK